MIISEKQILQLMASASELRELLKILMVKNMVTGDHNELYASVSILLRNINNNQSESLKEII